MTASRSPAVPREPRDRRLWWPALGAWAGALLGLRATLVVDVWAPVVAGGSVAVLGGVAAWVAREPRRRAVALAAGALGVAVVGAAARAAPLLSPNLSDIVARGARVHVEAVVTADPVPVRPDPAVIRSGRPQVDVRVTVLRMTRGTALDWSGSVPASLRADDGSAQLLPGTRVAVVAAPAAGFPERGIALRLRARGPLRVLAGPPAAQQVAGALRQGLVAAVADRPPDAAALLPGLAIGDVRGMPPELADAMRAAGLSHVTAVSGANVAIVVAAGLTLAARLRLRGVGRALVAVAVIAGFVLLVRAQPSVLRAAAMGAVGALALWVGGRRRGPPALAAAVLVLVVVDPWLAASYGFALSVVATAGLLRWAGPIRDRLVDRWRVPAAVADAASVTVAAQLATAPLLVAMGSPVGPIALPANLLAAPAVGPATLSGLLATLVSPASLPLATLVALPGAWAAGWIAGIARAAAAGPGSDLTWPTGPAGVVLAAVAVTTVVGWGRWWGPLTRRLADRRRGARTWLAAATALLVPLTIVVPTRGSGWPPPGWLMAACDVGQGDALVLRADEGTAVVVDAGPDPAAVDRCLRDLGVSRVPAVILSHFHADHAAGLAGVARGRAVGVVTVSPLREPVEQAARVAAWAATAGVPVETAAVGDERVVGALRWRVLWPRRLIRSSDSPPNDASVVLLADVAGVRLLCTGDVQPEAQAAIRAGSPPPAADVLKVPHHGSRRQDPAFAPWSGARLALVSVGRDNDYGQPAPALLAALAGEGIEPHRTDREGDLAVVRGADGRVAVLARGVE